MTATTRIREALRELEQAATALAEIGTQTHQRGILLKYQVCGGALGDVARRFVVARRAALDILS